MKWINAETKVTITVYDEQDEEHTIEEMTVEEILDTYTNEGCPTIVCNPERKKGKWIYNTYCSECGWANQVEPGFIGPAEEFNFCPNCGADMRGENEC